MSYRSAEPYTMEATIQDLTTQKIRELFTLCGIGDTSDECINSVVSNVSDYDGLSPQTPPATPHEVRGSYRLLSYADKRGPAHFEGLAGRERKRGKRHKKGSGFKNEGKKTSASPGDESVVTTETKLGDHIPLAADALGADRQNTNPVNLSTADPDSLGFEVVPRMETLSQSALERPSAALANSEGTNGPSSSEPPISSLPPWLDSGYAAKVVTTVLMNCVKLNSAMGLHGRQTMKPSITTDPSRIQQYTEAVSKLEYNEAVRVVKRDNAVAAGRTMQARLNETVYWDIILKGAKLIDPSALPIAKGPSDGFTSAEKAATRRFMEDAGYGIGAENQRQHRNLWKGLFQMRQEGISKFLAYRTQEFDSYYRAWNIRPWSGE
ncbi:hypothetical protein N8T08_003274 [Aspergillus melleus]|uniref:Uncharacterized protein n=1 Tax=Aspergillus melleus TaxID=138277 RepID=A0ACC3B763_9EURO|nr:hypothetical protein N8T08_003274 [Aspergillus melleus]